MNAKTTHKIVSSMLYGDGMSVLEGLKTWGHSARGVILNLSITNKGRIITSHHSFTLQSLRSSSVRTAPSDLRGFLAGASTSWGALSERSVGDSGQENGNEPGKPKERIESYFQKARSAYLSKNDHAAYATERRAGRANNAVRKNRNLVLYLVYRIGLRRGRDRKAL